MARKAKPRRRPGRPSILTEELAQRIIDYARAGNYVQVSARAAGITKQTLYNWQAKAAEFDDADARTLAGLDEETALLVWFVDALKEAEALAEVDLLAEARKGASGWQASMTVLERRFPPRWRRRDELEHSGEVGVKATLEPEKVREELEAFGMPAASAVAAGPEAVEAPKDA